MATETIETTDETDEHEEEFDPGKHVRLLGGNEYLDVKWRIVWFRRDHPQGSIETFLMEHKVGEHAVFKAEIRVPHPDNPSKTWHPYDKATPYAAEFPHEIRWIEEWDTRTTGWGSETKQDFHDYLEKAETKAIGRALAAMGYGTASLPDDGERIVDAPVERQPKQARQPRQAAQPRPATGGAMPMRDPNGPATEAQINAIIKIAARKQITDLDLIEYVDRMYAGTLDSLNKGQASAIIQLIGDQSFAGFGGAANGSSAERQPDPDPPLERSAF